MDINLIADSSVNSAPSDFTAAIQAAANIFDQDFLGNYTVNITYGWGTYDGQTNSELTTANNGISSIGGTENSTTVSYATVKSWLTASATLSDQQAAVASLPSDPSDFPGTRSPRGPGPGTRGQNNIFVSSAQEKALGVYSGSDSTIDGSIGFNDTDPTNSNFLGLALTEIAHALGWITDYYANAPTIADLFRFGSQDSYQWTGGEPAYFSLDDGATDLANFATTFDYTLFTNLTNDALSVPITPQTTNLTSFDIEVLNAVGFGQAPISASVSGTSFSVQEGQSVSISSELTVSNPDGDNVTEYQFLNSGGDGGRFVVGGTTEAAGQWFEVSAANLTNVSYVGGSSVGTDTLQVEVFDATSGTWSSVTTFTATTIGQTADMIMRDGNNGNYEIYGIGSNAILTAAALGQIGLEWQVAGLGDFSGTDTSDMLTRDSNNGAFEVYDIRNNQITSAAPMGQVGMEWSVAGFGDFSTRANETDMLMRDNNNGNFEVYDISNNTITFAAPMGQVGMEWTIAGFGDFSGRVNETDMLMRNSNSGAFEVYDINNNAITFATGMGQVGLEWTIAGFGDFSSNANETDMLMHNSNTGAFEVYDISNNQVTYAASMGQVGLEWQVAGFGDLSSGAGETDMLLRNSNTGAFEYYDIAHNTITAASSMGQVGTEWQTAGIASQLPGSGAAAAQLAQAMASYAPASAALTDAGMSAPVGVIPGVQQNPLLAASPQGIAT
jgi:hypothetical protein